MGDNNDVELQVERLTGRVLVIESRLTRAEDWIEESRAFHVEMRTNWDQLIGSTKAMERMQAQRHMENTEKIDKLTNKSSNKSNLIALLALIILFFALVCSICMVYLMIQAHAHAQNDPAKIFHSSKSDPAYAKDNKTLDSQIPQLYAASWR